MLFRLSKVFSAGLKFALSDAGIFYCHQCLEQTKKVMDEIHSMKLQRLYAAVVALQVIVMVGIALPPSCCMKILALNCHLTLMKKIERQREMLNHDKNTVHY